MVGNRTVCKNLLRDGTVLIAKTKLWNNFFSTFSLIAQIPAAQSRYIVDRKLSFRTVLDDWLLKNFKGPMIV